MSSERKRREVGGLGDGEDAGELPDCAAGKGVEQDRVKADHWATGTAEARKIQGSQVFR